MSGAHLRLGKPLPDPLDAEGFTRIFDVSRETLIRLSAYLGLLQQWQRRIDLVAPSTMPDAWRRHILDSAQLAPLISDNQVVADLGAGAGFPGLVLGILGKQVHLVESDQRKAVFLREAVRMTGATAQVHAARAETLKLAVDMITARAFAPLPRLLTLAFPLLKPGGSLLLLKGERVEAELTDARRHWTMDAELLPSRSDPRGTILRLREIDRVESD